MHLIFWLNNQQVEDELDIVTDLYKITYSLEAQNNHKILILLDYNTSIRLKIFLMNEKYKLVHT